VRWMVARITSSSRAEQIQQVDGRRQVGRTTR
jgi:hypothetical protein